MVDKADNNNKNFIQAGGQVIPRLRRSQTIFSIGVFAPLFSTSSTKAVNADVISVSLTSLHTKHTQNVDLQVFCLDWTSLSGATGWLSVKVSLSTSVVMFRINTSVRPFLDKFRKKISSLKERIFTVLQPSASNIYLC